MQTLTILGATGSIGLSTLDVVRQNADQYQVFALTANNSTAKMAELVLEFHPKVVVMGDEQSANTLRAQLYNVGVEGKALPDIHHGLQANIEVAKESSVDSVVAAIVGAAGLQPTLAAVNASKRVLLANKEALVMAGGLFMNAVKSKAARLLPVDSEHNAMFQCFSQCHRGLEAAGVRKLILTGSGGPFRSTPYSELASVTPTEACAHPNWSMGKKISVDSATMMNKGLEFIEACWLFAAKPNQIQVVIHPQSIVHSMVEYIDGSVLAQLGQPDMRTPIAHCLAWPDRIPTNVPSLDFWQMGSLEFSAPDYQRFPALKLAIDAFSAGGTAPAILNAANEVAVQSFLDGKIPFLHIADVVDQTCQVASIIEPDGIDDVIQADLEARALAQQHVERYL